MTIHIENLTISAIIGILDKERTTPQKIVVDVELDYEYQKSSFIDYTTLVHMIEKSIITNKFKLLEDALLSLHAEIKVKFNQISSIKLKITKPSIFDQCDVSVSVNYPTAKNDRTSCFIIS